jgi:hypothetical protein
LTGKVVEPVAKGGGVRVTELDDGFRVESL